MTKWLHIVFPALDLFHMFDNYFLLFQYHKEHCLYYGKYKENILSLMETEIENKHLHCLMV